MALPWPTSQHSDDCINGRLIRTDRPGLKSIQIPRYNGGMKCDRCRDYRIGRRLEPIMRKYPLLVVTVYSDPLAKRAQRRELGYFTLTGVSQTIFVGEPRTDRSSTPMPAAEAVRYAYDLLHGDISKMRCNGPFVNIPADTNPDRWSHIDASNKTSDEVDDIINTITDHGRHKAGNIESDIARMRAKVEDNNGFTWTI